MRKLLVVVLLAASLLIAGCGGSGPKSATGAAGGPSPGTFEQDAYKHADCMRAHGVSSFPDPVVTHSGDAVQIRQQVTPGEVNSPAFKTAQQACRGILPQPSNAQQEVSQHAHELGLLSFAQCMRGHGVSDFPDPTAQGQINPQMLAGIDLQAPSVDKAAYACVSSSDGQVNRAAIAAAIAGGPPQSGSQSSSASGGGG